ncbi:hypothetical protein EDB83DRAFT_2354907 [Lactarius deliciosus]|nr:hypothetical protein EDB83DRAFT_2354907 [Lactarius deliciosus]
MKIILYTTVLSISYSSNYKGTYNCTKRIRILLRVPRCRCRRHVHHPRCCCHLRRRRHPHRRCHRHPRHPCCHCSVHPRYCCRCGVGVASSCSWSLPPPSCRHHRSRCRGRGRRQLAATTTHRCRCRGRGRFVGVAKLPPFVATPPSLSPSSAAAVAVVGCFVDIFVVFGVVVMVVAAQPLPLLGSRSALPSCRRGIHPATTLIALVAAWGLC